MHERMTVEKDDISFCQIDSQSRERSMEEDVWEI